MNKKMSWFYREYCDSNATELYQVYGKCSQAKRKSYEDIKRRARELGAVEPVRILSHNTYNYTCGYIYPHPKTGVLTFRVETSVNTYECDL